jgi:hypothetical protein
VLIIEAMLDHIVAILGGLAAVVVIGASLRSLFTRTIGRRRDRYRRLARLATGTQLSFFVSVLGEPPVMRHTMSRDIKEMVRPGAPGFDETLVKSSEGQWHYLQTTRVYTQSRFVDRDYTIDTISDEDETILQFAVTTLSHRFTPTFEMPPTRRRGIRRGSPRRSSEWPIPLFRIRLGRTRFSELAMSRASTRPCSRRPAGPAAGPTRRVFGSEDQATSRPSSSRPAAQAMRDICGDIGAVISEVGGSWPSDNERRWEQLSAVPVFRRATAITRYEVVHATLSGPNSLGFFGG